MANPEHLKILEKGVAEWNKWRDENREIVPDLSEANLQETCLLIDDLSGDFYLDVNLSNVNLEGENLEMANLQYADLSSANLSYVNLKGANLSYANLSSAILFDANLCSANLFKSNLNSADLSSGMLLRATLNVANLFCANFSDANLCGVNFSAASLIDTNFSGAKLHGANFKKSDLSEINLTRANISFTNFSDVDLSQCIGLNQVICNEGPANIGHATLIKSRDLLDKQPEVFNKFLAICGFPQQFIDYIPSLIQSLEPIQFVDCFLSYAGEDRVFAERLFKDLRAKGVQCWYDQENAVPGDDIKGTLRREIHVRDKMILVLSENSITKPWVFMEATRAMEEEESRKKPVLIPIRLDDTIFDKHGDWVDDVKKRFIGDFIHCDNDAVKYQKALDRLLVSLQKDRVELI
jgi:uncharacterized protein YjbI with pentapeptide repeats